MGNSANASVLLAMREDASTRPGQRARVTFDQRGGSIGRGAGCDWVLDGAGVSRLHASIRNIDGTYFIEDHSTNGVVHNGAPLRRGYPAPLRNGDSVQIDVFAIEVTVVGVEQEDAAAVAPIAAPQPAAVPAASAAAVDVADHEPALGPGPSIEPHAVDPLEMFSTSYSLGEEPAAQAVPLSGAWTQADPVAEAYRIPSVRTPAPQAVLPDNWDHTHGDFGQGQAAQEASLSIPRWLVAGHAPAPSAIAEDQSPTEDHAPSRAADAPAAGIAPPAVPEMAAVPVRASETQVAADPLLLAMTQGLMEILRARAELKNSLRLPVTLVQRTGNNPMKIMPTAEEALERLRLGGAAHVGGVEAVHRAVRDVGSHQAAMLAGMRAAFEHMFAQFDPARFEQDAAGGWRNSPWKRYCAHYQALSEDPDTRFDRLFGDAFAHAYEQQSQRSGLGRQGGQA
jgi:type VI secretion system protein ImpI